MTANQIIAEINSLSPEDQLKVVHYAYRLDAERKLTGPELSNLAERMVKTTDPDEIERLRSDITRGFYGADSRA